MNYTSNLHLPIIPSNQYSTTRVADMIAANQGDSESSAFNIIDTAIAGKQNQITINPTGETATATIISIKIDGVVYKVAGEVINIDSELSTTSTNPVQNKIIKAALDAKQDTLVAGDNITIVDNVISATGDVDDELSATSTNPVQNKVVKQALDAKQGKLTPGNGITIDDNNVISGSSQITVDEQLSATSTNPVQNKVIKAALDDKIDASSLDPLSITISESVSQDQNALTAKSFTFTDSGVSTIYNIRDGSVPQLLTAGYVYSTAVTSGDTITDANLIEAYTAHMPITINGHLLSYQDTVGTSVRYLYSTLSDSKVYVNLVELDTTSHIITFHEVNLSAGGGVTEERVQEMINESIISAINSSY